MRNILLGAKYLAIEEQDGSIELEHLTEALKNVQVEDANAAKIIESLFNGLSFGSKSDIGQEDLDKAANAPKVEFSDEVKELLTKLVS